MSPEPDEVGPVNPEIAESIAKGEVLNLLLNLQDTLRWRVLKGESVTFAGFVYDDDCIRPAFIHNIRSGADPIIYFLGGKNFCGVDSYRLVSDSAGERITVEWEKNKESKYFIGRELTLVKFKGREEVVRLKGAIMSGVTVFSSTGAALLDFENKDIGVESTEAKLSTLGVIDHEYPAVWEGLKKAGGIK